MRKSLQNFSTMDDFVKSYLSAQKLVGANKVATPNKNGNWFTKIGTKFIKNLVVLIVLKDISILSRMDEIDQTSLKKF